MDINTGKIYPTLQYALNDGVNEKNLIQGTRETLEKLRQRLNLDNKYLPLPGGGLRERARRLKQLVTK